MRDREGLPPHSCPLVLIQPMINRCTAQHACYTDCGYCNEPGAMLKVHVLSPSPQEAPTLPLRYRCSLALNACWCCRVCAARDIRLRTSERSI